MMNAVFSYLRSFVACFLFLSLLSGTLVACEGKNEDKPAPEPPQPVVSLSQTKIDVNRLANSSATLTLTSNVNWSATGNETWCSCAPSSGGSGTSVLVIKATSANTMTQTRTAAISFSAGSVVAAGLQVVQQAGSQTVTPPPPGTYVTSLAEFNTAQAAAIAGTEIVWANGTYSFSGSWTISRDGITVKAQTDGGVVFTGALIVKLLADNVTFRGFRFIGNEVDAKSPASYGGAVDLFTVGNGASNSSATTNATKGNNNKLLHLNFYGAACRQMLIITPGASGNLLEYCNFEAKQAVPKNSVVQIQVSTNKPGNNILRYCSFKNHFAPSTGDYGMEALRIGYSHQKDNISHDLVEYCYFYRCCGDDEVISSKAAEVVYRYNTFEDNGPDMRSAGGINYNGQGHLCIRHGHRTATYGNFFNSNRGMRICEGGGHVVYNNYFNNCNKWPFRIDQRDSNTEAASVDPVSNVTLVHNSFASCVPVELEAGNGQTGKPTNVVVANNLFANHTSTTFAKYWTAAESFEGNVIDKSTTTNTPASGLTYVATATMNNYVANRVPAAGQYLQLKQHTSGMAASSAGYTTPFLPQLTTIAIDPDLLLDIMKNTRPSGKTQKDIGCTQYGGSNSVQPYVSAVNTGPAYLR